MANANDYKNSVLGKGFDMDNAYGVQCVDGFKHFCKTVLNFDISNKSICSPSGYAYNIWDNYESLGLNKYFDKVASNQMVEGDWAIWNKNSRSCKDSHIAMFIKDNKNGLGLFLGQNQNGHREYTESNLYYDGIRGALRPKIYHQTSTDKKDTRNYINIPPEIELRNVYDFNLKLVAQLKPKKFGGLSYYIYQYHTKNNELFAEIQTQDFGRVLVKITDLTRITVGNYLYEHGTR